MDFKSYLSEAWNKHAENPQLVAQEFPGGLELVGSDDQLSQMAGIITHVMGEHLGRWDEGIKALEGLRNHPCLRSGTEAEFAIQRSIATLQIAKGQVDVASSLSLSDRIRALAMAASALCGQSLVERSKELFREALSLADSGLNTTDPAHRALAVTGNNMACALEEKSNRNKEEVDLMLLSARMARKHWEIAGGWLETERAEYRLAMSHLKADDAEQALRHAQNIVEICTTNNADPIEFFFGFEALALAERARGNDIGFTTALGHARRQFEMLSEDDRSWCQAALRKLTMTSENG